MKRPGIGGADRREIAPVLVVYTLSGATEAAVVRVPIGGDSCGSSNNESGLSSPSLSASASSGVGARRRVAGEDEARMSRLRSRFDEAVVLVRRSRLCDHFCRKGARE